ncbi:MULTISPECIES: S41 family peptidase [Paenibacillus]|uniref:Carboxyl-terminal protease n=2 Tax=Paenibacillus lactis TaxID=228574 RepID=G4HMA1_9BACL|nr:S41 family peptidase [Paenibacillus lactis]EHB54653.1 carboxyl-terminal protease [Paenibacillus lactis 154]MBP1890989.1 carboxyl-terminal processing protease [Paenibacillus lactis]MCM3493446.1 S41 family peptidase [Paenibacillus lactis]GIO92552.1 carboxy-terminal processing protease CtpB [Paenibacillus lactis]HAF99104.1 PDZ domain-containing protein [Paenibacillus lactis]
MLKKRTVVFLMVAAMLCGVLITMALTQLPAAQQTGNGEGLLASISNRSGLDDAEARKLGTALDLIEDNYYKDVDRSKLVDGAINGMMEALGDPYSNYMGEESAKQFTESIAGSFSGIGAEVSSQDGNVVVVSPIKGSPADKAGIRAKDTILSVNGESLQGLDLNAAVAKIRGPKGSKAVLKIKRAGSDEPIELVIVRDDVSLETVTARMEKDGIGIIEITQFSSNTGERFTEELEKLEKQGMKGLVIDVRNNPGGVLSEVIGITENFVPKGKLIVQVEDKDKKREKHVSNGQAKPYPITVLMNKGSASASEILAGALQESAGATLVGEHSFGKGTVQTSFEKQLGDGSLLKVTIAKWLTPNGTWIHEKGIEPDIKVDQPEYFTVAPIDKKKTYKYDANSSDVKNAQIMLEALGFDPGRTDGYFDRATEKAVKSFQSKHKLKSDGVLNSATAESLEAALIEKIQDPKVDNQLNRGLSEVRKEIAARASKP